MTAEQIVARIRELLDSDNVEGADFVMEVAALIERNESRPKFRCWLKEEPS